MPVQCDRVTAFAGCLYFAPSTLLPPTVFTPPVRRPASRRLSAVRPPDASALARPFPSLHLIALCGPPAVKPHTRARPRAAPRTPSNREARFAATHSRMASNSRPPFPFAAAAPPPPTSSSPSSSYLTPAELAVHQQQQLQQQQQHHHQHHRRRRRAAAVSPLHPPPSAGSRSLPVHDGAAAAADGGTSGADDAHTLFNGLVQSFPVRLSVCVFFLWGAHIDEKTDLASFLRACRARKEKAGSSGRGGVLLGLYVTRAAKDCVD